MNGAGLLPLGTSMKMTDSPGAMLVMPLRGTAAANDCELSSIFQPEIFTAKAVGFVTSSQSAPTGLLPLDHGATSEMNNLPTVPGEPISLASLVATMAPLTPTALSCEIIVLFSPAALLKVGNDGPAGEGPKSTVACNTPLLL